MDDTQRVTAAIEIISKYGGIDGGHHKQWVLDQVMRILLHDCYDEWLATYCKGEDGPDTYSWDTGIAP